MSVPEEPIRIVLVNESRIVRSGVRTLLSERSHNGRFQFVAETGSAAGALAEVARLTPDVVLLDIRLADAPGFEVCRQLLEKSPKTRVLVLTAAIDDALVYEAMNSGAHGYLMTSIDPQALARAVIDVAAGKFILDPTVTARVLNLVRNGPPQEGADRLGQLSAQERRVLSFVAEGKTNKEIAEAMGLSDKTVKNYLSSIFEKLQINRRSQAAALYAEKRAVGANGPS